MNVRIYSKDMPEKENMGHDGPYLLADFLRFGSEHNNDLIEHRIGRTEQAIAKLLCMLRGKNIITDEEMFDVVDISDWDVKKEELTVKVEL